VLIAVELGPIGLVMYLAVIVHLWRGLTKIRRTLSQLEAPSEQQRQQAIFSRMLQASLVGNFVAGLFLSTAYFYAHWVNIALAMAFVAMFNRDKLGPTLKRKSAFAA
jgi:O-antigen ligase